MNARMMCAHRTIRFAEDRSPAGSLGAFRLLGSMVIVSVLLLSASCKKAPDTTAMLQALEEAVRAHDYYFKHDPPIPPAAYERAAAEVAPGQAWDPSSAPREQLAKILSAIPADRRNATLRKAFNILLAAGNGGESTPGRRNYYINADTDARLQDPDNTAGAGIVLYREPSGSGRFRIVDVLEGSPAHVAGIPQGALIESIDGQSLADLELEDVVAMIRGKTGTSLQIRADGKDYTLVRGLFGVQLLRRTEWDVNGKRVLYVEIRSAGKGAAKDLESLLMKASNLDALVLDLRKLNMGDIDESFKIADLFVANKTLGLVKRRDTAPRPVEADGNVLFTGRVYVLVSAHTSSHLRTIAMGMRQSPQVVFIGPDLPLEAFVATEVPLGQKGEAGHVMIVESTITSAGEARLHPEEEVEDFVPSNPPSMKPDPHDPAQAALLKRL